MARKMPRATESTPETQIIPSLSPRGAQFREELLTKILPWQQISDSLQNFPYYIQEHTKSLLLECVASNLKQNKLQRKYSAGLNSSSHRILLQSIPGGELYRERLVRAVAREMKVPLMRLDLDHGCDAPNHLRRYNLPSTYGYHKHVPLSQTNYYKKGDRVQYTGIDISFMQLNNRTLSNGQRGEVYQVKHDTDTVGVVFNIRGLIPNKPETYDGNTEILGQSILVWLNVRNVRQDHLVQMHDCYIAMEVLNEVLESQQPLIVYFADSFSWPPLDHQNSNFLFERAVENIFDQLPEGAVMICSDIDSEDCKPRNQFPKPLEKYLERMRRKTFVESRELDKLFSNVICIKPPKDEDLLVTFIQQMEEDRLTFISEANLKTMHKVLKDHNLSCTNLEHPIIEDKLLRIKQVEKIVGWAINHYFSSGPLGCVNEEKMHIPLDSINLAIARFMEEKNYIFRAKMKFEALKGLSYSCKEGLDSAVTLSEDIDVKIDDVGVHESVKKVLYETVILPMKRPELFSHGNMLGPCKGILLFGPPGTGKTLLAKALANESGANFIHITTQTRTYMMQLFEELSSIASKLAPAIIYLDEVDTFPGACGRDKTGKSGLNEFIEAWDQCKSKESRRVFLIGATNRPFDIDEIVIRHMPRRIYVGLPDVENRFKILKTLLSKENLEPEFSFEQLAEATQGYSGSDLKNLCSAAAYGPIEEILEEESKGEASDGVPALRPLTLTDFIRSTSKVRPSAMLNASSYMKMKEWKEQFGEGES